MNCWSPLAGGFYFWICGAQEIKDRPQSFRVLLTPLTYVPVGKRGSYRRGMYD